MQSSVSEKLKGDVVQSVNILGGRYSDLVSLVRFTRRAVYVDLERLLFTAALEVD